MYGNPIFQRYHSQVFAQFSYKYPMPNAPVFWLNLAPQWVGQRFDTPLKANIRTLG